MLLKKICFRLFVAFGAIQLLPCEKCDVFETRIVDLTAKENSVLSFEVNVSTECMPGTVTLTVRQVPIDNRSPVCSVDYTNGSCIGLGPSGICSCDNDTNKYIITLNVTDRQNTSWLLKTSGTGISDDSMTVTVSVQYPSEIVNLTIENDGKAVTETSPAIIMNTAVNISCQWKEGNPPDPPQLSRDGVVLSTNTSVKRGSLRHVSHVIHHVLCNDTGIISCEAAGASSNKRQMLHVKCEPLIADRKITFLASSKDKTLKFPVTAFHHHVVTCQLQRYKATENVPSSLPSDCTSKASLSGSVPNLTLTIQLPEGTSQMKGRWRLDLRNGDENGSVYFTIVTENNPEPSRVPIGAVIVPIVVIVVVIIVVIVVWRQRFIHKDAKIGRDKPGNRRDRLAVSQSFYRRSNVSVMITNDLYEGCDTTRSPVELDYTDVHDAIQPARDGTPGTTTVETLVAAGVSLQAGVSAQAGAELGDMDDGDYEEISPRQPAVSTRSQQHVRQQLPPTTLTPPKPCHSSEVTGDYADVE